MHILEASIRPQPYIPPDKKPHLLWGRKGSPEICQGSEGPEVLCQPEIPTWKTSCCKFPSILPLKPTTVALENIGTFLCFPGKPKSIPAICLIFTWLRRSEVRFGWISVTPWKCTKHKQGTSQRERRAVKTCRENWWKHMTFYIPPPPDIQKRSLRSLSAYSCLRFFVNEHVYKSCFSELRYWWSKLIQNRNNVPECVFDTPGDRCYTCCMNYSNCLKVTT